MSPAPGPPRQKPRETPAQQARRAARERDDADLAEAHRGLDAAGATLQTVFDGLRAFRATTNASGETPLQERARIVEDDWASLLKGERLPEDTAHLVGALDGLYACIADETDGHGAQSGFAQIRKALGQLHDLTIQDVRAGVGTQIQRVADSAGDVLFWAHQWLNQLRSEEARLGAKVNDKRKLRGAAPLPAVSAIEHWVAEREPDERPRRTIITSLQGGDA